MSETFLVLLAGGVMLAVVIPDPRDVTVNWMRLGGVIALTLVGLSIFFYTRRAETGRGGLLAMHGVMLASILSFLGGIHMPIRAIGRPFALVAAGDGALLGANLLMGRARGMALVSI